MYELYFKTKSMKEPLLFETVETCQEAYKRIAQEQVANEDSTKYYYKEVQNEP